jgi:type VI secretion system protein ImpH
MLSAYFCLPVSIQQFLPQWQDIMPDMLTQMPTKRYRMGQNAQLGVNAIAGQRIWSVQAKFRIHIAPINYQQYESLAPGSSKLHALHELVRLYVGLDLDYDIELQIPARELPPARLRKDAPLPLQLGWNGYLPSRDDDIRVVTIRLTAPDIT